MKFLKQLSAIIVVAAVMAGAGWWLKHYLEERKATQASTARGGAKTAKVTVTQVMEREFTDQVEAIGTLRSNESIEISSKVTETVDQILFDDGQLVEKGQTLALLSAREEEATLAAAKANLEEQNREIRRLQQLVEQGAAPAARLEERQTQAELARRQIQEAEARIADRHITAPFSGMLGLRRISPGALVEPGTLVATLDQIDTMKLDFTVPEIFLTDLKPGLIVHATSAAFPGRKFEGKVSQVDSRIDPVTRSITVRAELQNKDHSLRPGMLLTVNLNRNPRKAASVPERAIVPVNRRQFVFRIDSKDGQEIAHRVEVVTGARLPGYIEIVSGVQLNDTVITDGYMGLADGATVIVAGEFKAPAAPYNPRKN